MSASVCPHSQAKTRTDWHEDFLTRIKPAVETHAAIVFRKLPPFEREELSQAALCLAWSAYRDLLAKGKGDRIAPGPIATFSCRQAYAGRIVGGELNTCNPLSREGRRKHGFEITGFGDVRDLPTELHESLADPRQSSIPDHVAFRVDLGAWLRLMNNRLQSIARHLAKGHSTSEVARKFGLSNGRISQLRREFANSWASFQEEPVMV